MFVAKVLTLFPEAFPGLLGQSVVGRALGQHWALDVLNIRDYATDKHRTVDDTPYGGGAGMVLKPDVVAAAIAAAKATAGGHVVYLGPAGRRFNQAKARTLAALEKPLILLCGHYEGVDERVLERAVDDVISIGDYVLSGGEVAAQVVLDATVRLLPGVLGGNASLHEESFDLTDPATQQPLVEYPHYTRPAVWEGHDVPAVLQGGNHAEIAKWRLEQARERTLSISEVSNTSVTELHVNDFSIAKSFYTQLGFNVVWERKPEEFKGYLVLAMQANLLCLWGGSDVIHQHPFFKERPRNEWGTGVEIVICTSDLDVLYKKATALGCVVEALKMQPWGLNDFRIRDPFGYYIRVTTAHDIRNPRYAVK